MHFCHDFARFLSENVLLPFFLVIFFLEIESLALVLQTKSRQFPMTGDKVNAHAGMPFCGVSQFVMPVVSTGLWSYRPRTTALWGRGSFVFISQWQV